MADTVNRHKFLEFAACELGSVVDNELCWQTMGCEDRTKTVNHQNHGSN